MSTLHVTNGDVVAGNLLTAGFTDPVLPWRDVLHDGPVPSTSDAQEFGRERATFLAERGWTTFEIARADFAGRDAQLAAAGAGDDVILWFEPDLYDQLQLLQILSRLYIRPLANRPSLSMVAADMLLGPLAPGKLAPLFDTRRRVREVDLELAAAGWEAFTASDPGLLVAFAGTETALFSASRYADDATVVLPYVHPALRRQLQEYPSLATGLSRTEQQTLEILARGERPLGDVYRDAHAPKEEWAWLGDWSYAWYLERLSRVPAPLIEGANGELLAAPGERAAAAAFWAQRARLSALGQQVVQGAADAIDHNGIDRWVGGVHLTTAEHWRWDERTNAVVSRTTSSAG